MTTATARAAARVTYQLETLWDHDYEPTHAELETLYETAKMAPAKREYLEDFTLRVCDAMYARDERTGFQSIKTVWNELGCVEPRYRAIGLCG